MAPEQSNRLATLTEEEFTDIYNRLLLYAHSRFSWVSTKYGVDLEDVVQESIVDLMTGARRMPPSDPQTGITEKKDVFIYLYQIVRSKVSHRLRKERLMLDSLERVLTDSANQSRLRVEATAFDKTLHRELTERIQELVSEDEELNELVRIWLRDPTLRPNEIAEKMGISMSVMYRSQKRLSRHLKKLKEELQNA